MRRRALELEKDVGQSHILFVADITNEHEGLDSQLGPELVHGEAVPPSPFVAPDSTLFRPYFRDHLVTWVHDDSGRTPGAHALAGAAD